MWGVMSASLMEIEGVPCIISITRDISAAKAAENTIRSLAFYDPLTGLPNRRLLLERLRQPLAAGARNLRSQALLLVDLDHFKILNDTLGHRAGDLMLKEVARRVAAAVHEGDTVCRLGGDEFVVMIENLSNVAEEAAAQAKAVGEHVLAAIDLPYSIENREYLLTASIGIAVFAGRQKSVDDVLQQADIAMDQAKAAGRNTMRFFSPALQAAVNARAAMEVDLRQAIKTNQFLLYYQPQVERGRVTGAEALIRWNHPMRGLVMPDDFIPLAEESRLILPMGNWVLETACAQIATWARQKQTARLIVAVNISALQFRQPEFVEQVLSALARTGANPENLRLELTESILVENIEEVIAKMTQLRLHGLRFSLDDFGTGYSSLAYLKRLPLDCLKIDRSFVRDILIDSTSGAIARAIISVGHAIGLSVMAEGVETEKQRSLLAGLGCHSFQGYLLSRPLPLEQFEEFIEKFT
jgi:diguanylate cyclase (GGDEF)-like protein